METVVLLIKRKARGECLKKALEKQGIKVKLFTKINSKTLPSIFLWLKKNKYDVIHADSYSLTGWIATKFGNKKNIPSTIIIRGIGESIFRKKRKSLFQRMLTGYFEKKSLNRVNHVFFISKNVEKHFLDKFPFLKDKSSVMHNGIDYEKYSNAPAGNLRKEFKINEKDSIIITVTNLTWKHPYKMEGVKLLIESMELVEKKIKNFVFVIVGGGKYLEECKKYASKKHYKNKIIFAGFIKDIPEILKASNLFVYSSKVESFGMVIKEAQASGLPVIAGKQAGIIDAVDSGGVLVEPKPENFAIEIINMLNNPNKMKEYSEKSKNVAKSETWDKIAQKYKKLWESL